MSELITIDEFARSYRVGTETVRSWIKSGYIDYELVSATKMVRKSQPNLIKPIQPDEEDVVVAKTNAGVQPNSSVQNRGNENNSTNSRDVTSKT